MWCSSSCTMAAIFAASVCVFCATSGCVRTWRWWMLQLELSVERKPQLMRRVTSRSRSSERRGGRVAVWCELAQCTAEWNRMVDWELLFAGVERKQLEMCRDGRSARSSRVAVSLHRRFKTLLPRNFGHCRSRRSAGQCCPSHLHSRPSTSSITSSSHSRAALSLQFITFTSTTQTLSPYGELAYADLQWLPSDSLRQLPGTDFRRGSIKLPLTASSNLTSSSSSSSFTLLHLSGRSHDFGSDFMG